MKNKPRLYDLAWITLVSTALAIWWSNNKLLNQDEMFSYQTDTVHSLGEVVRIQLHFPISLDPLVFHSLAHLSTRIFGPTAFAMRLPSMLGYALMLCCVFLFTERAALTRWSPPAARSIARIAATIPILTATFYYATEARPYGLLLGFYALSFLAWQAATRPSTTLSPQPEPHPTENLSSQREPHPAENLSSRPQSPLTENLSFRPESARSVDAAERPAVPNHREPLTRPRWALPTLALAIALALNTHYFAILLLPLLFLAEFVRTVDRRRVDLPLVAALLLGTAAIVCTLPFQTAVRTFRTHYYNAGAIGPRAVTQAFRSLFVDYTSASLRTQHFAAILFVVLALAFLIALALRWRTLDLPPAEATLLLATAALPVFGFLLGRFVTHSFEVRYVIGAIFAISILLALLLAPWIVPRPTDKPGTQRWLPYLVMMALVLFVGPFRANSEKHKSAALLHSLEVPAAVRAALAADPTHNLYIQQMGHYEIAQFYQPDPVIRAHTVLVYSSDREIFFDRHDTEALTAEHMLHFTGLPIVSYDTLTHDPTPHTWLLYNSGWDFTPGALAEDQAHLTPIAPTFEGTATTVQFPPQP